MENGNEFMADIFISYANEDVKRVWPIVKELEKLGISVFFDRKIPAGESWRYFIKKELDESRCVLVFWSQHSINSAWVREEAVVARKRGVLVPLLLDEVQAPFGFRIIQAADLSDWKNNTSDPEFLQLIHAIEAKIASSSKQEANEM